MFVLGQIELEHPVFCEKPLKLGIILENKVLTCFKDKKLSKTKFAKTYSQTKISKIFG